MAMIILGLVLVAVGAIVTPLPPPFAFGIVLLLAGIGILATWSRRARRGVQAIRIRFPTASEKIEQMTPCLPSVLRRPLHRTRPTPIRRLQRLRERLLERHRAAAAAQDEAKAATETSASVPDDSGF